MTSAPFQQYPHVEELQQSLMITKHVTGNKRMNTKRKDSTSERNELHDGAAEGTCFHHHHDEDLKTLSHTCSHVSPQRGSTSFDLHGQNIKPFKQTIAVWK